MKALKVTSLATAISALMMLPATACDFGDHHAAAAPDKPVAAAPAQAGDRTVAAVAAVETPVVAVAPAEVPSLVPGGTQTADTSQVVAPTSKPN